MTQQNYTEVDYISFWNDCCGRNIEIVHKVMEQYDDEEILRHIDNGKGYGTPFEIKEVM